jgi:Secretin and TonB N terminus short domain.
MSHTGFTSTHLLRTVVATSISCISLACASAPPPVGTLPSSDSRFHTVVSLDSSGIRPVQRPDTGALPVLTVSQLSESGSPSKRIQLLDAGDKDLPIVLRGLAQSFGLNYQIDSNVHGTVQTRLQDVTLEEALDAIVLPQGYTYSLDNGVLRVGLAKVQTKIFALDYVALSRSASTSTTVQRRIGGGGSTSGGGGGGGVRPDQQRVRHGPLG